MVLQELWARLAASPRGEHTWGTSPAGRTAPCAAGGRASTRSPGEPEPPARSQRLGRPGSPPGAPHASPPPTAPPGEAAPACPQPSPAAPLPLPLPLAGRDGAGSSTVPPAGGAVPGRAHLLVLRSPRPLPWPGRRGREGEGGAAAAGLPQSPWLGAGPCGRCGLPAAVS